MKKTLALLLAVLVALSMFSVAAFAEETETDLVTIIFMNGDEPFRTVQVKPGTVLTPYVPENPTKPATDTAEYIFKGWRNTDDGELYFENTLPAPEKNTIYIAEYSEQKIAATQSFWNFIESIFARINLIFQYFAEIFRFD